MDSPRNSRTGRRSALTRRLSRWLRPPRTLRPTRAGWIFFALTFGVGFAALNTGNNLLYLVLSLMLAFLVLSGVLSESAVRGIGVRRRLPGVAFAGRPARVVLEISNAQERVPAFAIVVEDRVHDPGEGDRSRPAGRAFVLRVGPGGTERVAYRFEAPRRGRASFSSFRVSTRFPFGLFLKSLVIEQRDALLVYPGVEAVAPPAHFGDPQGDGEQLSSRDGAGCEVGGLRDFRDGDSARRVQWRASLRRGSLVVRDVERERDAEVEVQLRTQGPAAGPRFEGAVRHAASEIVALMDAGARVALRTDRAYFEPAGGLGQRARLLSFLALVQPERQAAGEGT